MEAAKSIVDAHLGENFRMLPPDESVDMIYVIEKK